jgi:hypothetical protein
MNFIRTKKWVILYCVLAVILLVAVSGLFTPQSGGTGAVGDPVYQGTTFAVGGVPVIGADGVTVNTSDTATSLKAPTGRGATYVVAASTASTVEKAQADYVFTGTPATDTPILQAYINAINATGKRGTIQLLGDTFTVNTTITDKSYVNLIGNGATLIINTTSNVYGVDFNNVTNSIWSGVTVRRQGIVTGQVFAAYFRGTTDTTCQMKNGTQFINEVTGGIAGNVGIFFNETCSPSGDFIGVGPPSGSEAYGIQMWSTAAPSGTFKGTGGAGTTGCTGIYIGSAAAPTGTFTGAGGTGTTGCHGIHIISSASISGTFVGTGAGTTDSFGIVFAYAARVKGTYTGTGGSGGDGCHGVVIWDASSPTGTFTGYGGSGGSSCVGIWITDASAPSGDFVGVGGTGGTDCFGIAVNGASAPTGKFIGKPQQMEYIWSYLSANNGRFQPNTKAYQLIAVAVGYFTPAVASTTLDLGTTAGASDIVAAIPIDTTNWQFFNFVRAEVAAGGYMYATINTRCKLTNTTGTLTESGTYLKSGINQLHATGAGKFTVTLPAGVTGTAFGDGAGGYANIGGTVALSNALVLDSGATTGHIDITLAIPDASFKVHYTTVPNYTNSYGLYIDTTGFAVVGSGSDLLANGASDVVYIGNTYAAGLKNWKITNSHLETYDPTNQKSINCAVALTDLPVYQSTLVGGLTNVTSFVKGSQTASSSGTWTVLNTATTAVVTHGLGWTPAAGDIAIGFITLDASTSCYIDTYTSTEFTVHINVPATVATTTGWWKAIR